MERLLWSFRWFFSGSEVNLVIRHFNRQKYLEIAKKLNIPAKTAEGYITGFIKSNLIHREQQDIYTNLSIEENEDIKKIKD